MLGDRIKKMDDAFSSIRFAIVQDKIPRKRDVKKFQSGWYDKKCVRSQFSRYFPQVFGDTTCIGSGKPDYVIVVAKKYQGRYGGLGTHVFCKKCLNEYIKKTGKYIKKGNVYESPDRKIFVYNKKELGGYY